MSVPDAPFIAVAGGGLAFYLGLEPPGAGGSIVVWGSNTHGQHNVPAPNAGFTAIAAGDNHALGLKDNGSIIA